MLRRGLRSVSFWLAVAVLALGFFANPWRVVDDRAFENFGEESDALVLGGLARCAASGISPHGLWAAFDDPEWVASTRGAWLDGGGLTTLRPYTSQLGLQGWMYCGLRAAVLGSLAPDRFLLALEALNSTLLAFFVALIVLWTRLLGRDVGMALPVALITFSPWLTQIGSSVYWVPWTWFLPMVVAVLVTQPGVASGLPGRSFGVAGLLALAVFVKSAAGYEFISFVLVTMMLPFLSAYLRANPGERSFGQHLLGPAAAGLSGFGAAMLLHAHLRSEGQGIGIGVSGIFADAVRRTTAQLGDIDALPDIVRDSLLVPVTDVLRSYLALPVVDLSPFAGFTAQSFLLAICASWLMLAAYRIRGKRRDGGASSLVPLGLVSVVAALAPLSWFALAKGHSYIHEPINPALWTVPLVPLAVAFGGSMLSVIFGERVRRPLARGALAVLVFTLATSLVGDAVLYLRSRNGASAIAQPSGERFSVFRSGRDVVFVSWSPELLDLESKFFVHVYPDCVERLPADRRQYGFDNLDFEARSAYQVMPPWSLHRGVVIFKRRLPSTYEPRRIAVGQYRADTRALFWSGELSD